MLPPLQKRSRDGYMQSPCVCARLSHRPLANSAFHKYLLILSGPRASRNPRTLFWTRCEIPWNIAWGSNLYFIERTSGACGSIHNIQGSGPAKVSVDLAVQKEPI